MQPNLLHETWVNLLRLTGENISDQQLPTILKSLRVERLEELNQEQAEALIEALQPLPRLKNLLWEGCIEAIEQEQAKPGRKMSKVDPFIAADTIVPLQMDRLAHLLIKQAQISLFDKERPQG